MTEESNAISKPLFIHGELAKQLKPHQEEGWKFILRNCFADRQPAVGGCVLAHHMGAVSCSLWVRISFVSFLW